VNWVTRELGISRTNKDISLTGEDDLLLIWETLHTGLFYSRYIPYCGGGSMK
jgi:hypothetical protein